MPFERRTVMEQKRDFVALALQGEIAFKELCRRFGISRPTGYKWMARYRAQGEDGLHERSRRPKNSPNKIDARVENWIVSKRKEEPEWGAKKLHALLKRAAGKGEWKHPIPSRSTIHQVLDRNGLILPQNRQVHQWERFEYALPNQLWQMDFKGWFRLDDNQRCHTLTMLDDHSRYNLMLHACNNQRIETVQEHLIKAFRHYGLPHAILTDNGSPWGATGQLLQGGVRSLTKFEKWLIQLGVHPIHGRPYHPQTQGKEERFHKTLQIELLNHHHFRSASHYQENLEHFRYKYNHKRPHESLEFAVPAERYAPSERAYPEQIPRVEYPFNCQTRKVQDGGYITFKGQSYRVGKGLIGDYVAITQTENDGIYEVKFANYLIRKLNLNV